MEVMVRECGQCIHFVFSSTVVYIFLKELN
jgi:hypothetical protein